MSPPAWLADLRLEARPVAGTGGYMRTGAAVRLAALLDIVETLAGALAKIRDKSGDALVYQIADDALAAYRAGPR